MKILTIISTMLTIVECEVTRWDFWPELMIFVIFFEVGTIKDNHVLTS